MQTTIFQTVKLKEKPQDGYKCPEEEGSFWDDNVDMEYCDSFNQGKGCRFRETCEAYNTHNTKEKIAIRKALDSLQKAEESPF